MDLSIAKLRQLVTVARCGSFSRAAVELNLSQPALSRSVAAIEERYGFTIFNRIGHGVSATAAGAQVLDQAKALLQDLQVFESNMRLFADGAAGELAMGMAPLLASQLLAGFAADIFAPGSQVQLRVMVRPGGDLLEALRNDEIELIFFPETHVQETDGIEIELVGHVQPVCVVRRGHALLDRDSLTIADLADFPWASAVGASVGPELPSKARMICDNYHILRDAVLQTDLVCICSRAFVADELRDGRLAEIRLTGLPLFATEIYVAKLKGRAYSPLAQKALRNIRSYLDH